MPTTLSLPSSCCSFLTEFLQCLLDEASLDHLEIGLALDGARLAIDREKSLKYSRLNPPSFGQARISTDSFCQIGLSVSSVAFAASGTVAYLRKPFAK
jgi:hypothetical protein